MRRDRERRGGAVKTNGGGGRGAKDAEGDRPRTQIGKGRDGCEWNGARWGGRVQAVPLTLPVAEGKEMARNAGKEGTGAILVSHGV